MRDHTLISYALKTPVRLNLDLLEQVFLTTENSSYAHIKAFSFKIRMDNIERSFRVTEHDVNRILRLPQAHHVPNPTPDEKIGRASCRERV